MKHIVLTACLVLATHFGQAEQKGAKSAKLAASKPAAGLGSKFTGKVVESMNTAGYTYVLVDTGKEKAWAAGVQFDVKPGDTVTVSGAMPMQDYQSKTLNRTFDVVYFASEVAVNGKSAKAAPAAAAGELPKGHPPISGASPDLPKGHPEIGGAPAKPNLDVKNIKKAGHTVAEVNTGKAKLKGQEVAIRGKVVKYNAGILGKNWLHVQDGSGNAANNDIVVTTDTDVKVGDVVLVKGKVSTDRDFGAGYKYAVIIENAKVTVE